MANNGYSVTIKETSDKLTAKQRVAIKDTSDAIKLDLATQEGTVEIDPGFWAVLSIHNEKSDNADYENYIIVDAATGNKYVTGSSSFWNAFMDIYTEMAEAAEEEPYTIRVYRLESKNYKGKQFLTCSIK